MFPSLTATRELPQQSTCQCHKSSCPSPCLITSFFSLPVRLASSASPCVPIPSLFPFYYSSPCHYSVLTASTGTPRSYCYVYKRVSSSSMTTIKNTISRSKCFACISSGSGSLRELLVSQGVLQTCHQIRKNGDCGKNHHLIALSYIIRVVELHGSKVACLRC